MKLIFWIIFFSFIGSVGSVSGAALLLMFPEGVRKTFLPGLVSYATGTLLGAAFLGMIPHALEDTRLFRYWQLFLPVLYSSLSLKNLCYGVIVMQLNVKCILRQAL